MSAAPPVDPAPVETASVPNPRAQPAITTLPEGDGKEFVQNSCGKQCHGIDRFTSYRLSRSGWQAESTSTNVKQRLSRCSSAGT